MSEASMTSAACDCGLMIELPAPGSVSEQRALACRCGRLRDLEFAGERWCVTCVLTPERSVPVSGFSRQLRERTDARRYWFSHRLSPSGQLIVHIVFSGSSREAEIKAADAKPLRFVDIDSPIEARRRWLATRRRATLTAGDRPRLRRKLREAGIA